MKRIVVLVFLSMFISLAFAYKVSPVTKTLTIQPGSRQEFTIRMLGAKENITEKVKLYQTDFSMTREGGLIFSKIESKHSAYDWIKLSKSESVLFGVQEDEVKVTISVPSNAIPGEYYATVMTEPDNSFFMKTKENIFQFKRKDLIAVTLLIKVPGRTYEKKGTVVDSVFVLDTENHPKIFTTFQSESEIHLKVSGEAVIKSEDGKIIFGKIKLDPTGVKSEDKAFVFPRMKRDFNGVFERVLPAGKYRVDVSYHYGYDFKLAKSTGYFTVKRDYELDESNADFLHLEINEVELLIPEGGRKLQVVKLTSLDYRPLKVDIVSNSFGTTVTPSNIVLKPGEVRNVLLAVKVEKYYEDIKRSEVTFASERGLSPKIKVLAYKNEEEKEVAKKKELSMQNSKLKNNSN